MKTPLLLIRDFACAAMVLLSPLAAANAQVIYVAKDSTNSVSSYDAATGTVISSTLITDLNAPYALAVSGDSIFVSSISNSAEHRIGKYNLDGTVIDSSFITGIRSTGIAVSGGTLYATAYQGSYVNAYNILDGSVLAAPFASGADVSEPWGVTVDASGNVYVANRFSKYITKYGADGTLLDADVMRAAQQGLFSITSDEFGNIYATDSVAAAILKYDAATDTYGYLKSLGGGAMPTGIAYLDGNVYVADYNTGVIAIYDAVTGAAVNQANWVNAGAGVTSIAVVSVIPEPSAVVYIGLAGAAVCFGMVRRKRLA